MTLKILWISFWLARPSTIFLLLKLRLQHFAVSRSMDSDSKQLADQSAPYCPWKELKSYCYSIIRGKLPPLHFRITFQLSPRQLTQILPAFSDVITVPAIRGLNLNLQYKNHELFCTSGISSDGFLPDKSPEFVWDSFITDYFRARQINFDRL